MRLYFVRHGESLANVQRVISNRPDSPGLTEVGRAQVAALAARLEGVSVQMIYTSPLLRAAETATLLGAALGAPVAATGALREYDCGVYEGRGDEEAWQAHAAVRHAWQYESRWDARMPQGESFFEMRRRFLPFLERALSFHAPQPGALMCVAHGGLYTCLLPEVLDNVDHALPFSHSLRYAGLVVAEALPDGRVTGLWWDDVLLQAD